MVDIEDNESYSYAMCDISTTQNFINVATNIDNTSNNSLSDNCSKISEISHSELCDNDTDNDTATENNSEENICLYLNSNYNQIDLAVLMNTRGEYPEELFENVTLPIMNIDYNIFTKFTYINKSRNFSCNLLDSIYKNLNFQLTNELLSNFSKKFSIDVNKINPTMKIKLIKECTFKNLSDRILSVVSLTKHEFINTIDIHKSTDKICIVNVFCKIYSDALKIGLNLIFKFKLENICYTDNNN